jgi:putative hydrolase
MIDLHMHTFWSDGELVPAEMVQRARAKGVTALALTDHVDHSNLDLVVPAIARFCAAMEKLSDQTILPGCELTHVPPAGIAELVKRARRLGAKLVVVHGETLVEPVPAGTNHAALLAGVDVLAHPGLIAEDDVKLAAKKNIALEISARKGHCLGNGRVAALARRFGAPLVLNTDSHGPGDLIDDAFARTVLLGAGLDAAAFAEVQARAQAIAKAAMKRRSKP